MKKHVLENTPNEQLIEILSEAAQTEEYRQNLFYKGVAEFLFRMNHLMDRMEADLNDIDKRLNKLEGGIND